MGYNTAETEWPSIPIPTPVKNLLDRFYNLLDDTSPQAGNVLADEIFEQDAKAQFGVQNFEGCDQIRRSREGAWVLVNTRKHVIQKVYVFSEDVDELLCISHVDMSLKNGRSFSGDFACLFRISGVRGSSPRLKSYSLWADSSGLVTALQST